MVTRLLSTKITESFAMFFILLTLFSSLPHTIYTEYIVTLLSIKLRPIEHYIVIPVVLVTENVTNAVIVQSSSFSKRDTRYMSKTVLEFQT